MTHAEKLKEIASELCIDTTSLYGKIELLKEILIYQDMKDANDFMIDTFMMLDDEIDHLFEELFGESETENDDEYDKASFNAVELI